MWISKGVRLLVEEAGDGAAVERQQIYLMGFRLRLNRGDLIAVPERCLSHAMDEYLRTDDDSFLWTRVRIDREQLIAGIFYAVLGMRIGGYRKVAVAPHLAYGEVGIPGIIPPKAKIEAEIKVQKRL